MTLTSPATGSTPTEPQYDFGGATFDLTSPGDRRLVCFILSQALYGEATGVYCGQSLYAARSLEAARFYLRQARQELNHLELFAEIFRTLELQPQDPHWVIKLLSSHNHHYPLKVLMEHAVGEGMVLDIFRDVLLQTLPDDHPGMTEIKKKLRVVCREEQEHVAWGEKEVRWHLETQPWLRTPYMGLIELQLALIPLVARAFGKRSADHPVLQHMPAFLAHVRAQVRAQSRALGILPAGELGTLHKLWGMAWGIGLFIRSQFSRGRSTLDKTYLHELGFRGEGQPPAPSAEGRPAP
jgi:hypothetical protein